MAQSEQEDTPRTCVAVHCDGCGKLFRARNWREGMTCPKCRSGRVKPLAAPGDAVDYYVADRTQGYTPADIRFAQWAKWCELITPRQYEMSLIKLNRQLQEGRLPRPIHEIMMQEGFLAEREALGLLEFLSRPRPDEEDRAFAEALQTTVDVDRRKTEHTEALQRKAAAQCHEVPPLSQLLVDRHVISEAQMLAVLKLQQRSGVGALSTAGQMINKAMGRDPSSKSILAGVSLRMPLVRNVAILIAVLALIAGMWAWQSARGGTRMYVKCERCGEVSRVRWTRTFPVKCRNCRVQMAYYAVACRKCGRIFTRTSPYSHEPCPYCGGLHSRPVRPEDIQLEESR